MSKLTAALILSAGLTLPLCAVAQDRDDHERHEQRERTERYYDQQRKDYHEWNEAEARAWRRYWETEHRPYVDWKAAKEEQRAAYWRWRHDHPDSMLDHDRR
jgi:hypothetical protein